MLYFHLYCIFVGTNGRINTNVFVYRDAFTGNEVREDLIGNGGLLHPQLLAAYIPSLLEIFFFNNLCVSSTILDVFQHVCCAYFNILFYVMKVLASAGIPSYRYEFQQELNCIKEGSYQQRNPISSRSNYKTWKE